MSKSNRFAALLFVILGVGFASRALATTIPIDLNDFFADATVTVAAGGSSASFAEDSSLFSVILANDPGLGDPNVIIPAAGRSLSFDFAFTEAVGGVDEFFAFVVDSTGFSAGPAFEFSSTSTSSGTVSIDLSSLVGSTLGLQFELASLAGDANFDSTLTVSNVNLVDPASAPEPPVALLLLAGLAGIWLRNGRLGSNRRL